MVETRLVRVVTHERALEIFFSFLRRVRVNDSALSEQIALLLEEAGM
jgi:hypothetical protein